MFLFSSKMVKLKAIKSWLCMSRNKFYIPLLIGLLVSLVFGKTVILEFRAEPENEKIVISWRTGEEVDLQHFEVQRSTDRETFVTIGTVPAKGSNSEYQFEDTGLSHFKNVFYYRLKIVDQDGSYEYTDTLPVLPKISSIKRTWGTIKALFR